MKTCEEKMAELDERWRQELETGKSDVELTWPDGGKAHCMRTAWVLVKSNNDKFFVFEQLDTPYERKRQPAYRFGYYILNVNGDWSRPQANPMFDAEDWGNILAALVRANMLDARVLVTFGA